MLSSLKGGNVPYYLIDLLVLQLVENAVGPDNYVVKSLSAVWLVCHVWKTNNAVRDASQRLHLCFNVPKSSTHTQSTWINSIRANKRIIVFVRIRLGRGIHFHLLDLIGGNTLLHYCLRLIDVPARLYYPVKLTWLRRFVIDAHLFDLRNKCLAV